MTLLSELRLVELPGKPTTVAKRFGPKQEITLKAYDVFVGDTLIGRVEQHLPTFERKPEGSRIVTSRWKTAYPRWIYTSPFERRDTSVWRRNAYRDFYETRKRCLEHLLSHYDKREGS
jgi:hypothetical protein